MLLVVHRYSVIVKPLYKKSRNIGGSNQIVILRINYETSTQKLGISKDYSRSIKNTETSLSSA